ncbi:shikimate kinase [Candidatus Fermentibacteria bacterium]|nr:shikimate kinase [Candidatus Fermentibacteria bacterium]
MPRTIPRSLPVLVAGPPFSGKTACGRIAAAELGMPFLDLDRVVETALGSTVEEAFAKLGEEAFRDAEAAALAECMAIRPPCLVALGGGTLLRRESLRTALAGAAVVTLTASREALVARFAGGRPLAADVSALVDLLERRAAHYDSLPNRIDNSGLSVAECAAEIVRTVLEVSAAGRG